MPDIICNICGKKFTHHSSLKYHKNPKRKYPCIPIQNNNVENKLRQTKLSPPKTKNSTLVSTYECEFCNSNFTRNDSLKKHLKSRCKVKKNMEKNMEYENNKIQELESIVLELQEKLNNQQNISVHNGNVNTNSNNINSNNSNNNIQINQNINLIAYGKEDISRIDPNLIKSAISKGYRAIPELVKNIHFNEDYPEYQNAYISSMKDSHAMIYNGNRWEVKDRNEFLDNLYEDKLYILEDKYDEFLDQLTIPAKNRFQRFLIDKDDSLSIKKIKKNLQMMLYNNRHMPNKKIEYKD